MELYLEKNKADIANKVGLLEQKVEGLQKTVPET